MCMKKSSIVAYLCILAIFVFIIACESTSATAEPERIAVSGVVLNQANNEPLSNVIVRQLEPKPEQYVTTNEQGEYTINVPVDSLISVRISYILEGFNTREVTLTAIPGRDISVPITRLISETSGPDTEPNPDPGDDPSPDPDRVSGTAASISLVSLSHESVVVFESGQNQQSTLVFTVTDSVGVAVDINNITQVSFSLGGNPGGGIQLSPSFGTTNVNGQVSTILTAGTISGVAQVIATINKTDGTVIRSRPISVIIRSGLPNLDHFSIAPSFINIPGYNIFGLELEITAFVGDQYGNVVAPGTSVYFTTNGGLIEGSSLTDQKGRATTTLITALPRPSHPNLGEGFATVRARTINNANQNIEATTLVLFSGVPTISASPNVVNVPNGGSQTINFTVSDQNGNPLASGTNITVDVEGENMRVIGDVDNDLPDTMAKGVGATEFQFTIVDADAANEVEEPVQVTIETTGPNGTAKLTLTGVTRKTVGN